MINAKDPPFIQSAVSCAVEAGCHEINSIFSSIRWDQDSLLGQ